VEIREVGGNFWRRFSGSIDLGYTFTKASERTQFNLNSNLIFSTECYSASFAYDTIFSNSKGEKDIDRRVLTLESHRYMGKGWQVFGRGKWEHNLELELDERFSFLGGPAYDVFKTNRSLFRLGGGISYTKERYFEKETVNNAEAAFGIDYQLFKLYTPKADWINNFFVYPNITTSGRVRLELDTKLRLEIFKDFFINFSFYDSYDNQPPSETATKNDYGFVTGVSWSFN
jgi:hypothetical protein